jgi:glycerophosphoryl diester phosphodiesterase
VVFHDHLLKPELCRHPDGRWLRKNERRLVRDLSASELRQFDVGRIKPRTLYAQRHRVLHPHDGERIPLLSEVIVSVRARRPDFKLFIEIKTCAEDRSLSAAPEAMAEAVVAELRATGSIPNAVLVGFDWAAHRHPKSIEPRLPCWFTTKRRAPHADRSWAAGYHPSKFKGSIAEAIARAGGDGWFSSASQATRSRIDDARRLGLKIGVWTVNDARSMRGFTRLGVDAIVTDRLAALS